MWETTNRQLIAQFDGPRLDNGLAASTAVLAFSPSSELVAAGFTKASSLVVWDLIANRPKWRLPERKVYAVLDCAFSPGGEQIATACPDGTVKLWSLKDKSEPEPISIGFQSGMQTCVAYAPDGKRLATSGDEDQPIKIWDTETRQEVARLKGEFDFFHKLAFLPDGDTLVAASQREVRIWRAANFSEIANARSGK